MDRTPSIVRPALLMGALFGFVTALPFVDILTVCTCCSLVALCGFTAAYVHSTACRRAGAPFHVGAGALVGLLAGLVYGVVGSIAGTLVYLIVGDAVSRAVLEWMSQLPSLPEESAIMLEDTLEEMGSAGVTMSHFVLELLSGLGIGAVFSTVGGLIGGAVFKVSPTAPPPPSMPPPPAMPPGRDVDGSPGS